MAFGEQAPGISLVALHTLFLLQGSLTLIWTQVTMTEVPSEVQPYNQVTLIETHHFVVGLYHAGRDLSCK